MILKNEDYANVVLTGTILEYDMSAAGPSVARAENLITEEFYRELMSCTDKHTRQVKFGLYLGKYNLQTAKEEALNKYVNLFLKENAIKDVHVMEIASDAIWLLNPPKIHKTSFNEFVKFRLDRSASIMISYEGVRYYADAWDGNMFTRGLKLEDNPNGKSFIKNLLNMIEEGCEKEQSYKFLHEAKMHVLKETLILKNKEYALGMIDFLLKSII